MLRSQYIACSLVFLLLSTSVNGERHCESSPQTELLVKGGVFAATLGVTYVAAPIVLGAIGFGPLGVIGGSIAALFQSYIGNVAGNSLFALLTSLGATGANLKSASSIAAWAATSGISEELEKLLGLSCFEV
ncbi:interferon alpha-inducible protein 27-like protein 2 isoform X2 [Watersipora subatra]|uniref:interferon alpha-inducible protein 27-like protein 2 isoform X2 n=1 Tax=Watersipora subatra TaxID=2589382 RepID=UPI00355B0216